MPWKAITKAQWVSLIKMGVIFFVGAGTAWFWPDNPVEQYAEKYIERETGVELDLSAIEGSKKVSP